MGLFGLLYATIVGGATICKSIGDGYRSSENKNQAIIDGELTYYNAKGQLRYVKDDKLVSYSKLAFDENALHKKGDYVLRYITSNNRAIIKNFTLEERMSYEIEQYKIALQNGRTVYPIGGKYDDYFYIGEKIRGRRYKDFKTGDIYVIRSFNGLSGIMYYMNIATGQIVRKTDEQLEKEKKYGIHKDYDDYISKAIIKINEEQKGKWARGERDYLNSRL